MPTEDECSSAQMDKLNDPNFCVNSFCPAANAAWPHELDELCRPLVAPQFVFGEVEHAGDVPDSVKSFCAAYTQSIMDESQSHVSGPDGQGFPTDQAAQTSGCLFSELYEHMLEKCQSKCVKRTWACLVPQSYCTRVGNEADSISNTLKYFGDTGGLIDTSGVKRYDNEHECNQTCLASVDGGLPEI